MPARPGVKHLMKHPPHHHLRYCDLRPAKASNRVSGLPDASRLAYFFNARSALHHLFLHLAEGGRRRVLMPAFHCVSMVDPALAAGMDVHFYRVDRSLAVDVDDLMSQATPDVAAVVIVNFFGFAAEIGEARDRLAALGISIVEDCSHSFVDVAAFRLAGERGDFSVYSFAKVAACGVGGGLHQRAPRMGRVALHRSSWRESIVRTKRLLEPLLLSADEGSLPRRLYLKAESWRLRARPGPTPVDHDAAPAAAVSPLDFDRRLAWTRMPLLPRLILAAADLRAIATHRRANHEIYARELAASATPVSVQPVLQDGVCPWAYPVLVGDRARHDVVLRDKGVPVWTFGDQLHDSLPVRASERAIADARFLADHLLCLPVHQGLPHDVVASFARVVAASHLPPPRA